MKPADELSARISGLSAEKRALFERWKAQAAQPAGSLPRRVPREREPLSFAQYRLWMFEQLVPGTATYCIPASLRIAGGLRVDALARSLDEIVRRHEALRTVFRVHDGEPAQVVLPAQRCDLPRTDLRHLPAERREAEAHRILADETQSPFDLERGPVMRCRLLELSDTDHVLVLMFHHIAIDGWSIGIFDRELGQLYDAFASDARPPAGLPEPALQYADFSRWQRASLRGEVVDAELSYWRGQLAGAPTALALPTDFPRPAVPSHRGALASMTLSPHEVAALEELARRERATLFMVLLAAYAVVLTRTCGQDDVVIGTPTAGRDRPELEDMIGVFVNTLPLRVHCAGDPTVRELLARVRAMTLDAFAHQQLPFEQIVSELKLARDASTHPVFQTMLALQVGDGRRRRVGGLDVESVASETGCAKFDLWWSMMATAAGLEVVLEYKTELFRAETASRMLGHLQVVLDAFAGDPDRRISTLPLVTGAERRQLAAWNATARDYGDGLVLHELFDWQSERSPGAVAVELDDEQLTYGALRTRADRLACRLQALGVGPDTLVGICMERSFELVVGLLAILKAGGAYVPLDPSYPAERLAFMLEDAGVPVLVTVPALQARLPAHRARVVLVDGDSPERLAPVAVQPDHLAYSIYTSGSTGKPKGAMNTHRGICNRLLWMQERYRLEPTDRVLHKTPFSFDVSVWELFWPLITGARLVLARPGGHRDGAYLVDVIENKRITTLHFVPSLLRVFLEEPDLEQRCGSIARIICSGEVLAYDLQQRCFERLAAELHNLYGPTEASVDVTAWACDRTAADRVVPIGRPIANTQIHVLDRHLAEVPVGVPGELYIGGVGLARGYHRRPALTAERFLPDPLGPPGSRIYRTFDLARYLPGGAIEFLGRSDDQLKLRGFRIEPGEIEEVLRRHPAVRDVVVAAPEQAPGVRQLVAYVVPVADDAAAIASLRVALREHVRASLPEYMVPAAFVPLERLPLLANGKVDRASLPRPPRGGLEGGEAVVAPVTPTERLLAELWSRLLHVERPGIHQNFFELGGDSVSNIQIVSEARKAGLALSTAQVFRHPTIAALAALVDASAAPSAPPRATPTQRASAPGDRAYRAMVIELPPGMDAAALDVALRTLIHRHPALRTRHRWVDRELRLALVDVEHPIVADAIELANSERAMHALAARLDPGEGVLLQAALCADCPGHALVLLHTLAADERSLALLVDELHAGSPDYPAPTPQAWLDAIDRRRLAAAVDDDGNGAEPAADDESLAVTLGEPDTHALLARPGEAVRMRTVEVLIAALADALAAWTAQPRARIDLELDGRDLVPGSERTVGPLEVVAPLSLERVPGHGPGELLRDIKQQVRHALATGPLVPAALQIAFHYGGDDDRAGSRYRELPSPARRSRAALAIRAEVVDGRLRVSWTFRRVAFRHDEVADCAERFLTTLAALVEHCRTADSAHATPSDFPIAGLTQAQLDHVLHGRPGVEDLYPVTPMQDHMLFRRRHAPEPGLYVIHFALSINGHELDSAAFRRAWQLVHDRHPIMRTGFVDDGVAPPLQVVYRRVEARIDEHDWRGMAPDEQRRRFTALVADIRREGFAFDRAPQRRIVLIRMQDRVYQQITAFTYLVQDGWAYTLMERDFFVAYQAIRHGREIRFVETPRYRDFIAWLGAQSLAGAEPFWRTMFDGSTFQLPFERAPTRVLGDGELPFAMIERNLSAATSTALRSFARTHHVTLNTIFQGAWAVLLSRHTAQDDVTFGSIVSGRPAELPGSGVTVGFFNNLLPVRARVRPDAPLLSWLAALQAQLVELRRFEQTPLRKVYEWIDADRRRPLFDTYVVLENFPVEPTQRDINRLFQRDDISGLAQTEHLLRLQVVPTPELSISLSFLRARFSDDEIVAILEHLRAVIEGMLAAPGQTLAELHDRIARSPATAVVR